MIFVVGINTYNQSENEYSSHVMFLFRIHLRNRINNCREFYRKLIEEFDQYDWRIKLTNGN